MKEERHNCQPIFRPPQIFMHHHGQAWAIGREKLWTRCRGRLHMDWAGLDLFNVWELNVLCAWKWLGSFCTCLRCRQEEGKEIQSGTFGIIEGRNIKPFLVRTPSSSDHSIHGYIYNRQLGTKAAQYNIKWIKSTVKKRKKENAQRESTKIIREERPLIYGSG